MPSWIYAVETVAWTAAALVFTVVFSLQRALGALAFTSWAWYILLGFSLICVVGLWRPRWTAWAIRWLYVPASGIAWLVFWGVLVIFYTVPDALAIRVHGDVTEGVLIIGDRVVHVFPVLVFSRFQQYRAAEIAAELAFPPKATPQTLAFYLYQVFAPLGPLFVWALYSDPFVAYNVPVDVVTVWLLAVSLVALVNLSTLLQVSTLARDLRARKPRKI